MEYKKLIEEILEASQEVFEDAEVYISTSERLSIQSFQGEISKYEIAESGGLSLRGIYKGKMGYSYTEKLDSSEIDSLINRAKENSIFLEGDKEIIFEGSDKYEDFTAKSLNRDELKIEDKIDLVLNLEKAIKEEDSRIYEAMVAYQEKTHKIYIANTKGLDLNESSSAGTVYASSYARDGEDTKTGGAYRYLFDYEGLKNYRDIAKEAAESATSKLGAKTIKSGSYKIIIENESFADLLVAFNSIFSADAVQKNLSQLKGKLGEEIASKVFTIVDNPFLEDGFGSGSFDSEGTATRYKHVIKDGILKNYLHNWKTANKEGIESTGNGSRGYTTGLSIAPTNFYVEKGNKTFEELIEACNEGLLIDDLQGLHSGLNPVSGDFSLSASGFLIEGGKKSRPVNQITLAGNFFDLLKDIEVIGEDLKFTLGSGGTIGSPSVIVKKLAVSGE